MTTLKQQEQSESTITANCAEYLRRGGWFVTVHAQDRAVRRQSAGWVDITAFKHGVTLLVEVKTSVGRLRPAQREFKAEVAPHLWSTLRYVVARDLADVAEVLGDSVI